MEKELVNVFLIIGGALLAYGAVRLGLAIYKAEKRIKEIDKKEDLGKQDDN